MLGIGLGAAAKAYSDQNERNTAEAFRQEQLGLMKASEARTKKEFDDKQAKEATIKAIRDKYSGDPAEVVKKLYNTDTAMFGQGEHAGKDVEVVDMPNGKKRVNFYERGTGNSAGYQDLDAQQFSQHATNLRNRAMLAELGAVDDHWFQTALNLGIKDDEIAYHRGRDKVKDGQWKEGHDLNVRKADDEKEYKDKHLKIEGMRAGADAARAAQGKYQFVTVYDEKGVPQMVKVDPSQVKAGGTVGLPKGLTLAKPAGDKTDDRMKQVALEYKQTTDELENLQKNKRPGEYFSFGKDDPENQDNARIEVLRAKAQSLNDQMTAIRMAQFLPKVEGGTSQATPTTSDTQQGLPKKPPAESRDVGWQANNETQFNHVLDNIDSPSERAQAMHWIESGALTAGQRQKIVKGLGR